jgi:hypothetical protein
MTTSTEAVNKQARIELPEEDYERVRKCAERFRLSISGYIRMSIIERVERDERRVGSAK